MKKQITASFAIFLVNYQVFACNKPVDSKKIVMYVAFHGTGAELKGVEEGACHRGETVVIIPDKEYMIAESAMKSQIGLSKLEATLNAAITKSTECIQKNSNLDMCKAIEEEVTKKADAVYVAQAKIEEWEKKINQNTQS